ncbi:MAG: inorganic diphosphatase [Ruminococcus sp.]|nr:inorganic diphosphatase [Ruminococcus sp.]
MINRIVTVTIDRPMGSYHPEYKDMYYPINYGYIEGVMADDGEEQDAYVIGVDKPLETFTGKVIAVIKRHDDVEDKWVVCPEGCNYTKEEIQRLTEFQEKFFDSEIFLG